MFTCDEDFLLDNVFELKYDASSSQSRFGYVSIRRHVVKTHFSENIVLEIADISQKILYDKAMGERKLLSLINTTVSHEMRNPINSIHVQLIEMESLNCRLSDVVESL